MLANRVRELTSTTGTGDIALAGALPGHIGFSDAFGIGDSVIYVIEDGDNYEIGTGTLVGAATLERTIVAETLVGGTYMQVGATPIDLSGNARIYCAATADFLLSPTHDADVIREVTTGAGVTADGVLLKDGNVTAAGQVKVDTQLAGTSAAFCATTTSYDGNVQPFWHRIDFEDKDGVDGAIMMRHDASVLDYLSLRVGGGASANEVLKLGADLSAAFAGDVKVPTTLISGSAGLVDASSDADNIVIGGTAEGSAGLSIVSDATNGRGILYFTDGMSYQNQGGLIYSHGFDRLAVVASQTEVLHAYGTEIQARTQLSVQWGVAGATISKTTGGHSGPKLVIHNEDVTDGNLSSLQFTSSGAGETFQSATAGIYARHAGRNATYPYGDLLFHTTDSGGSHNQVLKLGFDQSATFSGSLSAVSGSFAGNVTLEGSANQYVGVLQDQGINLTLGSVAGSDARIYLYGTGNGQGNAGNIDIRTSGNAGVVTVGGALSIQGGVSASGIVNDVGTHNDVAFSQQGRTTLGQVDRGAILTIANRGLATQSGLVVEGASGQTGNLLEVRSLNAGIGDILTLTAAGGLSVGGQGTFQGDGAFGEGVVNDPTLTIGKQAMDNGGQATLKFWAKDIGVSGNGFYVRFVKDANTDELRFVDGGDKTILALANADETATFAGDVIGAQFYNRVNNSTTLISGGSHYNLGANILMRGEGHVSEANDMQFRVSGTAWATYDHNALTYTLTPKVIFESPVALAQGSRLQLTSETAGDRWDLVSGPVWSSLSDDLTFVDETGASYLSFRRSPKTVQFAPDVAVEIGVAVFSGNVSIASDNLDLGDNTNTGAVQKFHADRMGVNQNIMSLEGWWNGVRVASVAAQSGTDMIGKGSGELIFTTAPDATTGIVTRLRIEESGRFNFHGNELTGLASMHSNVDTSNVNIAGGSTFNSGANLYLYGPDHASQASDILFKVDATNTLLYDNSNSEWNFEGNKVVRVGPGNDVSLRIGADSTGAGVTDATIKVGRVGVPHYLNAEEPVGVWSVVSDGAENQLRMGGATSLMNAPTEISFWTAPDATTVTGSQQWKISNDGSLVSLGGTVIRRAFDTGSLSISGGTSTGVGANLVLYGASHVSEAGNIYLRKDTTPLLKYDDSIQTWDFVGLPVTAIDHLSRGAAADNLGLSGGTTPSAGGNIILYGESHATNPGDILFRDGATDVLIWDSSSMGWNFLQTEIINTPTIRRAIASSQLNLSGGSTNAQGGNIALFGETHATQAGDIIFRSGSGTAAHFDVSAGVWLFNGYELGSVGGLWRGDAVSFLHISGGQNADSGANILLYGDGHVTNANDLQFRSGINPWLSYNDGAGTLALTTQLLLPNGSAASPSVSFASDTDTGIYRLDVNAFGFVSGGVGIARIDGGGFQIDSGGNIRTGAGNAANPGLTFTGDTDTGLFRASADQLAFTTGGIEAWKVNAAQELVNVSGGVIRDQNDDGSITVSGGNSAGSGGAVVVWGGTHATRAADVALKSNNAEMLSFDASAALWDFQGNAVAGVTTISRGLATGSAVLSGGSDNTLGANLYLYGESHATNANDMVFRSGTTTVAGWDDSGSVWDWQNNDFSQVGNITGDNFWAVNASGLKTISGGSGITLGANVQLYGENHATQAWDIVFRQNSNVVGAYTHSAQVWNFQDKAIATTGLIKGKADTTVNRPAAASAGAGASMFDTTLGKPIWSDGSQWVDATGAAV